MKSYTVQCEYPAQYRSVISVEAVVAVAACRNAVAVANRSDIWTALDWEQSTYVVALAPGATSIRGNAHSRRPTPVLPVPGLFTDVTQVAGYAAAGARI